MRCWVCMKLPINNKTYEATNGTNMCLKCYGKAQRILGNNENEIKITTICPEIEKIGVDYNG